MANTEKSLQDKLKAWLVKTGYPFEMEIAKCLQAANFGVMQSEYFEDEDSGKWRETDVIAYEQFLSETTSSTAVFSLVVECKGDNSKPWVLFSSEQNYPEGLGVMRRATNEDGAAALRSLSLKTEVKDSYLFKIPERTGYGIAIGLGDSNDDKAYAALNSVCKAALAQVKHLSSRGITPFVWPIIVVNANLFESYLDSDGELQVDEIEKGLLIWKNPLLGKNSFVQIYTKKAFFEEAKIINSEANSFLETVTAKLDEIEQKREAKNYGSTPL